MTTIHNVVIIGGGPAALTAAIYAGRANLEPIVFEGIKAPSQIAVTSDVENYPGFPESINGQTLVDKMHDQAEKSGAKFEYTDVAKIDVSERPFKLYKGWMGDEEVRALSIIICTGATAIKLTCEGSDKYWTKGVSACAICDSYMAKDKIVAVVGGGDVACEEANYLTKHAKKVYLIHRRDSLRASMAMQKKVLENPKIEILWNKQIKEIRGDEKYINQLVLKEDGRDDVTLDVGALFYGIGHEPATTFVKDILELDGRYIKVGMDPHYSQMTSVPGIFAAGDCCDPHYKQAIIAAGAGAKAAIDAEEWLSNNIM